MSTPGFTADITLSGSTCAIDLSFCRDESHLYSTAQQFDLGSTIRPAIGDPAQQVYIDCYRECRAEGGMNCAKECSKATTRTSQPSTHRHPMGSDADCMLVWDAHPVGAEVLDVLIKNLHDSGAINNGQQCFDIASYSNWFAGMGTAYLIACICSQYYRW